MGPKHGRIKRLALRAACMCWRWKKRLLIRFKCWELNRFIKPRGAPTLENTSVLRLWWGSLPVTKCCTSRNGESCSTDVGQAVSLVGMPSSLLYLTLSLPFSPLIKPVTSFWLSICFLHKCHCLTIHVLPCTWFGLTSSSKPLQL